MDGDDRNAITRRQRHPEAVEVGSTQPPRNKTPSGGALQPIRKVGKWLVKVGPARPLLGVGLLAASYAAYRLPSGFIDQSWLHFDLLRRSLLWVVRGTAFRSIVGPLALLVGYGATYWLFRTRKRQFIVVSDFRIWGESTDRDKFPDKGVSARLRDELKRLWGELTALSLTKRPPHNLLGAGSGLEPERFEVGAVQLDGSVSLPETHVTLQYQGISLEALNTFVRRSAGREVVITGELVVQTSGFVLIARTTNDGPWEVIVKEDESASGVNTTQVIEREQWELSVRTPGSDTLGLGLQRMAFLIMTTMAPKLQAKPERAFALLQTKARNLEEFDLAIHLAKLGLEAARDGGREEEIVKRNLATAYNDKGVELAKGEQYDEAIVNFGDAFKLDPRFEQAYNNLKQASEIVGERSVAEAAMKKAEEIRPKQSQR